MSDSVFRRICVRSLLKTLRSEFRDDEVTFATPNPGWVHVYPRDMIRDPTHTTQNSHFAIPFLNNVHFRLAVIEHGWFTYSVVLFVRKGYEYVRDPNQIIFTSVVDGNLLYIDPTQLVEYMRRALQTIPET